MADRVRINLAEKNEVIQRMQSLADETWNKIDGELTNLVLNYAQWWEGDAYERFKEDFKITKQKFRETIYDEIIAYKNNLDKAVEAQSQQDTSNAGKIGIN